ncbi:MAG: hypothetical protein PHQ27_02250 [Victivallales bacterium]|nr:hypothetical protein [Victivallales bacterium]
MRKVLIVGAAVITAMWLCSCVSSKRMMRVSPLDKQPEIKFDSQIVNLWPAYYGNAGAGAILWPVADWDQNGFAARPFFLRDNHEYAILFPLCAWNPVSGDGWLLSVYWHKDRYGMIPFFHVGQELSYFGPVWYFPAGGEFGVFPFYRHNNARNSWLFPLYLYRGEDHNRLIMPLFGALGIYRQAGPDYLYYALNWFYTGNDQSMAHSIIPLYYYQRDQDGRLFISLLFNRSWGTKPNSFDILSVAGPLLIRRREGTEQSLSVMWPLYIQSSSPNAKICSGLPFFWYRHRLKEDQTVLDVMGPVVIRAKAPQKDYLSVMWPLYIQSFTPDSIAYGSIPFFWYKTNPQKQEKILDVMGPLLFHKKNRQDDYLSVMWPLYIQSFTPDSIAYGSIPFFWYKTNPKKQETTLNVMGPMVIHSKDPKEDYLSVMWPFFIRSLSPDTAAYGSIPFFWYKHRKKEDKTEFNLLWPLFSSNGAVALINWNEEDHNIMGPFIFQHQWVCNRQAELSEEEYNVALVFSYRRRHNPPQRMPALDYERQKTSSDRDNYRTIVTEQKWSFLFSDRTVTRYNTWREHEKDLAALEAALRILQEHRAYDYIDAPEIREKRLREWQKEQEQARKDMSIAWTNLKLTGAMPTTDQSFAALQQQLYERYCREVPGFHCGTPLLFDVDRFGDNYKWHVLFFLARGEKENDRELNAILEYFYRYRRNGDHSEMLLFPFITRQTAPGKTRTSFLWRLFSYETDHGYSGGYCFFIPFGITAKR